MVMKIVFSTSVALYLEMVRDRPMLLLITIRKS